MVPPAPRPPPEPPPTDIRLSTFAGADSGVRVQGQSRTDVELPVASGVPDIFDYSNRGEWDEITADDSLHCFTPPHSASAGEVQGDMFSVDSDYHDALMSAPVSTDDERSQNLPSEIDLSAIRS